MFPWWPVDIETMSTNARSTEVDASTPAAALESLERVLGEHWGRAMWIDACRRAGVSLRGTQSTDDLRLVARELMEVPGPAGVIGRTLHSQITVCELLRTRAA